MGLQHKQWDTQIAQYWPRHLSYSSVPALSNLLLLDKDKYASGNPSNYEYVLYTGSDINHQINVCGLDMKS